MHHILDIARQYALPFLLVIGIVVFVHEFGHYWVARRCGIRVLSFSIGFGKPLFSWHDRHGTKWQVAWLPLGGYVKMFGDAGPASNPDPSVKAMTEDEKKVSFFYQSVNKRMAVVAAGPAFNYLFAILALALLFMFQGQPYSPPVVGTVVENSAAAHAGLQPGDVIQSIDGSRVHRFEDVRRIVAINQGSPMSMVVTRGGAEQTVPVTPELTVQKDRFGGEHKMGRIGIAAPSVEYKKWSVLRAIQHAAIESWDMTASTLQAVGQMIMGTRGTDELGGPLRIAQMSGQVAQDGGWALLWFMAIISINLGLINLFPVPVLDGGHLLYYGFEKLLRRPLSERVQEIGLRIGLAMIATLMLFSTWNDLARLEVVSKIRSLFS